jgi:hypothetical protein
MIRDIHNLKNINIKKIKTKKKKKKKRRRRYWLKNLNLLPIKPSWFVQLSIGTFIREQATKLYAARTK